MGNEGRSAQGRPFFVWTSGSRGTRADQGSAPQLMQQRKSPGQDMPGPGERIVQTKNNAG